MSVQAEVRAKRKLVALNKKLGKLEEAQRTITKLKSLNRQQYRLLEDAMLKADRLETTHNMFVDFLHKKFDKETMATLEQDFVTWLRTPPEDENNEANPTTTGDADTSNADATADGDDTVGSRTQRQPVLEGTDTEDSTEAGLRTETRSEQDTVEPTTDDSTGAGS